MPFPPPPRVSPRRRSTPRFIDRKTGDEKRHELWESGGGRPPLRAGKRGFKRALPLFPFPFPLLFMEMIEREKGTSFFIFLFRHEFCPTRSTLPFDACSYIVFFAGWFSDIFPFQLFLYSPIVWVVKRKGGRRLFFLDKSLFMILRFDFKNLPRRARPKFVQNSISFQQRSFDHNNGLLLFDRQTGKQEINCALRLPSKKESLY